MDERYNASPRGDCPRCYRARTLVLVNRSESIWQCGDRGREGCFALFRFESSPAPHGTMVRFREAEPARQSPEEFAARRARFTS